MGTNNAVTNEIDDFLTNLVVDYCVKKRSFTSLDIANIAKGAGHRIRNYQVAEWLRENVLPISHAHAALFNCTLITVDSKADGMTMAYVYHHYKVSADEYLDRDQNPKSFTGTNNTFVSSNGMPTGMPTGHQLSQSIARKHVPVPILDQIKYFETRTKARDFARGNVDYKFEDQGWQNGDKRWSCVRVN